MQKQMRFPLFYSQHIKSGKGEFPIGKESEYLVTEQNGRFCRKIQTIFLSNGLQQREEHRRLQCGVYLARKHPEYDEISTQNKINFICASMNYLSAFVYGLYVLFNSTPYDCYYRILNGSTQVNSTESIRCRCLR